MVRKGAKKEQTGAASRLKELTTLYFTSEMLERDQRHKGAKSQQRADMTLEADCHKAGMLKQIAWHKAENKRKDAKHKEEIRKQVSRQIEGINLMEAVHSVENQRKGEQHKKERRRQDLLMKMEKLKQADWHMTEMNWLRDQHKAAMWNQASSHEADVKRCKEEIREKLHANIHIQTSVGSTLTLVASVLTLVGSILTLVASTRCFG